MAKTNINSVLDDIVLPLKKQTPLTFFHLIGRKEDECFVSKIICYLINADKEFFCFLFNRTLKGNEIKPNKIIEYIADTEVAIDDQRRIDVLVKCKLSDGKTPWLIIENKIRSYEHDEQTDAYFNWVSNNNPAEDNRFIYLKPSYNFSLPKNKNFSVVVYRDLLNYSFKPNDKFAQDFKDHINYYLEETQMDDPINKYLENFDEMKKIEKKVDEKINAFIKDVQQELKSIGIVLSTDGKNNQTQWYGEDEWNRKDSNEKCWFYVEFVLCHDNLKTIDMGVTIKIYDKDNGSVFKQYLSENNRIIDFTTGGSDYLLKKGRTNVQSREKLLSPEWCNECKRQIVSAFPDLIKECGKEYRIFEDWFKKKAN